MVSPRRFKSVLTGCIVVVLAMVVGHAWLHRRREPPLPQRDPDLVARVGDREIRREDVEREWQRRGGARPDQVDRRALLAEMIERAAMLDRAGTLGLDRDPEVVRNCENVLIGRLRRTVLEPELLHAEVSDPEIKQHYEANLDEYTKPAKRRLAILFIGVSRKASDAKRTQAQARMREAREKALALKDHAHGFGAVAVGTSEDQATRYRGGDIGWLETGSARYRWDPAVIEAGFALTERGQISEIVTGGDGLYLVMLTDSRDAVVTPFDAVSTRIRHTLLIEKKRHIEGAFAATTLEAAATAVYEDVLESIPAPRAPAQPAASTPPGLP